MIQGRKPDEQLIEAWQEGQARDEISEILVQRHAPRVARFFQRRGFPDEACYDLTQDVLFRVFRSLPEFRLQASFETWLFQIVRNVWKNALRHSQAQKRSVEEVSLDTAGVEGGHGTAESGFPQPRSEGPLARVLVSERLRHVREAVEALPPDLQRLLICRIYQGLKVGEIAALLKIPEGTVKSRLFEARSLLKKKLEHLDLI